MTPEVKKFSPGGVLFEENTPADAFYIVQKGTLSIQKQKGEEKFIEIAKIYEGEVIGELSFFNQKPRSASVVALTECEVLEIKFNQFQKIYEKIPDYFKKMIMSMAERLKIADETIRRLETNTFSREDNSQIKKAAEEQAENILNAFSVDKKK